MRTPATSRHPPAMAAAASAGRSARPGNDRLATDAGRGLDGKERRFRTDQSEEEKSGRGGRGRAARPGPAVPSGFGRPRPRRVVSLPKGRDF